MLFENAVVYMKSTLFTKSYVQKYFPFAFYCEDCYCLHVYYIVYQHLNTQVHQNIGVCEVLHTYLLGCLRYGEKHAIYIIISCGYNYVVYKHVTQL